MTTKSQIKEWFDIGVENGATHMIVACDTFNYTDFPVWVTKEISIYDAIAAYDDEKRFLKIMEIYKMELGWEVQSSRERVRNV